MKLSIRTELVYRFGEATDAVLMVQAAHAPGQTVLSESLVTSPDIAFRQDVDPASGDRMLRARLSGEVALTYEATVDNGLLIDLPEDAVAHPWTDLTPAILTYLWPSRYCPSDQFGRFVERNFGALSGGARVRAILDWIGRNLDYAPGVSDASTTAKDTFVDRAGVCRDFSHLGVTLCRASGIPARLVSAYAWELDPPDFHAVFEVWLSGGWWLVDPTGLAPVRGLVRIACGRDAAGVAFLSTQGACEMVRQSVRVEAAA